MAKISSSSSQESFSRRHFHWTNKVSNESEQQQAEVEVKAGEGDEEDHHHHQIHLNDKKETKPIIPKDDHENQRPPPSQQIRRSKIQAVAISKLRSVFLNAFAKHHRMLNPGGLGNRVVGTLFGHKRGHVHFAFQKDANSPPAFLVELATPISGLVKEMASGLVRIALECDKKETGGSASEEESEKKSAAAAAAVGTGRRLLEEPRWRTYCNGKRCGFATRRECGAREWKLLKAVEPISMGAGVLPKMTKGDGDDDDGGDRDGEDGGEGEIMYMRAKFERVVGSRDSEAFYMMNPDSNCAPELSIYLLRV